ncbi:Crp/Fnr family transcriptional regulator [Allopusillimonas ginsengisoli]|uniref:Crp/Fnr family transcriptional regulator n=1 Tax=Allopusillimonas ginsengisoli TaxID=453575 RepID=UPI00101F7B3C|nr:Crp/Fnr family transcriptional regulator [Allopusillimonas ginsengisoli]TEA74243.1 Crp/Fnr family transcriptional regulator [Allopusillimonas ginsengisoli]
MTKSKIRIQDFLARMPLFSELTERELDHLALGTTEVNVARGEMVFRRGDACMGFHSVVYGQIKLLLVSPAGGEKVVRLIGPGGSFGEALMFLDKDYVVSAQALADTLLLHVGKEVVLNELERHPGFARKMLASLSQRLHSLMADVEAYSLRSGTERVVAYLLQGARQSGATHSFRLETSKTVIASRLNLTPEHFSRILHDLCARMLISVKGREITILDPVNLRHYQG